MTIETYSRAEWIDFVNGKIQGEKRAEMQSYLEKNPKFAESIEGLEYLEQKHDLQQIYLKIDHKIDALIKARKESILNKKEKPLQLFNIHFSRAQILGIAASLAILISFGIWFIASQTGSVDTDVLYAEHYEMIDISELIQSNRGSEPGLSESLSSAFNIARDNTNPKNVEKALEIIQNDISSKANQQFYIGIMELEYRNPNKASKALESYIQNEQSEYYDVGMWYYALSLLKTQQIEKAKGVLKIIKDEQLYKHESAEKILKKL